MNLENMTKIYARGDSRIQLKVIPGHFVTSQSHITHYLDLTTMKSRTAEAQNIAPVSYTHLDVYKRQVKSYRTKTCNVNIDDTFCIICF